DHDARWQRVDPPLSVLPGELDGLLELAALLTEDAARVERAHLLGTQRVLRAIRPASPLGAEIRTQHDGRLRRGVPGLGCVGGEELASRGVPLVRDRGRLEEVADEQIRFLV